MTRFSGIEHRQYVRVNTVFPVEFHLLDSNSGGTKNPFRQGFTRDIGEGGLCIEVNNLNEAIERKIMDMKVNLELFINIPVSHNPIKAIASVAWVKKIKADYPNKFLIGVHYKNIDNVLKKKIIGYARFLRFIPVAVVSLIIIMFLTIGVITSYNIKVRKENQILINKFISAINKKELKEEEIKNIIQEKSLLQYTLVDKEKSIASLQEKIAKLKKTNKTTVGSLKEHVDTVKEEDFQMISLLEKQLKNVLSEKQILEKKIKDIEFGQDIVQRELASIIHEKEQLTKATVDNMYRWLKIRQNKKTGLVLSFEGDSAIKDWAFTYDQALMVQIFNIFGDFDNAERILNFYKNKAQLVDGVFCNAYDSVTGSVTEYKVHSGPNAWLGISIVKYTQQSGDKAYLSLAENIADWLIKLQDSEGGIRGGIKEVWYATEHNLDAYAFFKMLYEVTGNEKYNTAQKRTLKWIIENSYTADSGRIFRGKGDSTIATDTFSWAIAAIGPDVLRKNGMDPDAIMSFAEENCKVTVDFVRPNGNIVKITGFDFAKKRHLPRGGVVSSEWSAQMIVSFKMMADYYSDMFDTDKAKFYNDKANFYMLELEKMIISSPSATGQGAGCFPYASQENVDTGHGWRTPKGKQTGSLAGTAYGIFANKGYNPLKLDK